MQNKEKDIVPQIKNTSGIDFVSKLRNMEKIEIDFDDIVKGACKVLGKKYIKKPMNNSHRKQGKAFSKNKSLVVRQIEDIYSSDLSTLLHTMRGHGLSVKQMYEELTKHSGVKFRKETLNRWLKKLGIAFSKEEAQSLRWKQAKKKGPVVRQIEKTYGSDIGSVLHAMRKQGLSRTQMYEEITKRSGVKFNKMSLHRWLKKFGIAYSREEAGRLMWKQGLMKDAHRKRRKALRLASIKGSKIEESIRWILKSEFEKKEEYETIIGFTNWTILGDLEVDIPITFIRKKDNRLTKFALEVDGEIFHTDPNRWIVKEQRIREAGWHPLRVIITNKKSEHQAHHIYVKHHIKGPKDLKDLIAEIDGVLIKEVC